MGNSWKDDIDWLNQRAIKTDLGVDGVNPVSFWAGEEPTGSEKLLRQLLLLSVTESDEEGWVSKSSKDWEK